MQNKYMYDISIIVPIYNEEENINRLYNALHDVLSKMDNTYEIIFVDDGSKDQTYIKLNDLFQKVDDLKIVKFRKNFGQTPAMTAGIDMSNGRIIITMDADMQNDPKDIPKLVENMKEGYDIVSGWRKNRKDKMIMRKIPSKIANRLISKITGVQLHDYGCTLKAYKADVLKQVNLYGELHRFIPAVANLVGVKIKEVTVNHHAREFGKSKYGISRTFKVILDLILVNYLLKYMHKPIHFFGKIGFISFMISLISAVVTLYMKFYNHFDITGNPFFMISILFVIAGFQSILTGVLAEMISRVYFEGQNKNIYNVEEILDKEERQ
ncbi:glycosyltransferase family 2 protein [Mycoplasmatota bacterium]|nr:glycosyltransferase family 2 protein [Mycoplasmatota bacterium]